MTRRLLLSYLGVTVIVLAVLEIPLGIVYQERERHQLASAAESDATVLATLYEDVLERRLAADPASATSYAQRTGARVVVVDAAGISIVDTDQAIGTNRDFSTRPEIAAALAGGRASGTRHSDTLDTDLLYVAVPVASGGNVWGAVRITLDSREVTNRIQRFWLGLAGVGLVILVAMTGIGFAIARTVTRPVRRLQGAAARFAQGDLTQVPADPSAPRELQDLQAALNVMARQLDGLLQQQREFVADASHQLRSPLTAIRLRLENLYSSSADDEQKAEIESTLGETTRLASLVGDLLHLARAERPPAPTTVNLSETCRERLDTWGAIAEQQGVKLGLEAPAADVKVMAVPGGIEQVLDNLLDNAVAASPPGSTVTVAVAGGDPQHRLTVIDQGPGLSDGQKSHAFDRFWRATPDAAGTGLGLPIVEAIVHAVGGTVTLTDNTPTGLAVTVTLPAADASPAARAARSTAG